MAFIAKNNSNVKYWRDLYSNVLHRAVKVILTADIVACGPNASRANATEIKRTV